MRIKQSIVICFGIVLALMTVVAADIPNRPPVADANGPYVDNEGSIITLDGSGSYDPEYPVGSIVSWEWDLDNDGEFDDASGETVIWSYADNDFVFVFLRVTDNMGETNVDATTVSILNVAPTVDAGPDATINEGDTFTGVGSFTDPGDDTWTATVQYGDGSPVESLTLSGKSFSLSHIYATNGIYTVQVTVEDDDGGVGTDTLTVTVRDEAEIPEFSTIALPVVAILSLAFMFMRRKK